jgi:hypothetical protein
MTNFVNTSKSSSLDLEAFMIRLLKPRPGSFLIRLCQQSPSRSKNARQYDSACSTVSWAKENGQMYAAKAEVAAAANNPPKTGLRKQAVTHHLQKTPWEELLLPVVNLSVSGSLATYCDGTNNMELVL